MSPSVLVMLKAKSLGSVNGCPASVSIKGLISTFQFCKTPSLLDRLKVIWGGHNMESINRIIQSGLRLKLPCISSLQKARDRPFFGEISLKVGIGLKEQFLLRARDLTQLSSNTIRGKKYGWTLALPLMISQLPVNHVVSTIKRVYCLLYPSYIK